MMSSEDLMELEAQRKDEERQDEEDVVEEPERFMIQEMARGLSLFEEVLLVFEALDLNSEQYMKAATAIQSANQCYHAVYDKDRKSLLPRYH